LRATGTPPGGFGPGTRNTVLDARPARRYTAPPEVRTMSSHSRSSARRSAALVLGLGALLLVTGGCARTVTLDSRAGQYTRLHPEASDRARAFRTTAILPPDIKVYSVSAGGVREPRDDWSAAGRDHVIAAVREGLKGHLVEVRPSPSDKETQEQIDDVQALYRAVAGSIGEHAYPVGFNAFRHKLERFEYSVGPVDRLLQKYRADALLIVHGYDEVSSGGRRALRTVSWILPIGNQVESDGAALTIALVDRSGTVLWFDLASRAGGTDFRDRASMVEAVKVLLAKYPGAAQ
jgi:hypothetical protein